MPCNLHLLQTSFPRFLQRERWAGTCVYRAVKRCVYLHKARVLVWAVKLAFSFHTPISRMSFIQALRLVRGPVFIYIFSVDKQRP